MKKEMDGRVGDQSHIHRIRCDGRGRRSKDWVYQWWAQ